MRLGGLDRRTRQLAPTSTKKKLNKSAAYINIEAYKTDDLASMYVLDPFNLFSCIRCSYYVGTSSVIQIDVSGAKKSQKTYNSGDSLSVTHKATSRPISCLTRAERTGSRGLKILWSYVEELVG